MDNSMSETGQAGPSEHLRLTGLPEPVSEALHSFIDPACKSTTPKALTATATSETSIILRWEEPDSDGGSPINSYTIKEYEVSRPKYTQDTSVNALEHQVNDLQPGTSYMFGVAAQNKVGTSEYGYLNQPVTTKDGTPEDMVKRYTALTRKDIQQYRMMNIDDFGHVNRITRTRIDESLDAWRVTKHGPPNLNARKEINLVLLGKTGAGKSATGNLILGENKFIASHYSESCTSHIERSECIVDDVKVNIIDTPGFGDTKQEPKHILTELSKIVEEFSDGIDGFLYVFNMGNPRFTKDEENAFNAMEKKVFDEDAIDNCFVLLTHIDSLSNIESLSGYLEQEKATPFGDLLNKKVKKRVIGVNNGDQTIYGREVQRQNIIRLILAETKDRFCSADFRKYQEDQRKLADKLPARVRFLAPSLQKAVLAVLRPKPHNAIKALLKTDSEDHADLVKKIKEKMMENKDVGKDLYEDLDKAVKIALERASNRLTAKYFLLGAGMLVLLGVAVGVSVATLGAPEIAIAISAGIYGCGVGVAATTRYFMKK